MEAAAAVAAAAAASTVAASTACLPSKSSDVPHVDLEYTSDLGCEVTDLDVQQAMMSVDHFVSCLSMEEPEGSSLPVQQSLLPLIPFGTGWAGSLSQNKWHQKVAAQQQAGCGDQCLNRQLCTLCDAKLCPCGAECSNRCIPLGSVMVQASERSFWTSSADLQCHMSHATSASAEPKLIRVFLQKNLAVLHHLTNTYSSAWSLLCNLAVHATGTQGYLAAFAFWSLAKTTSIMLHAQHNVNNSNSIRIMITTTA